MKRLKISSMGKKEFYTIICVLIISIGLLLGADAYIQTFVTIDSSGTIYQGNYVCGNYNSTHYYAQGASGSYELISTNASQVISYALNKWPDILRLIGTFSIANTITINHANTILDCRQATLTSTTNLMFDIRAGSTTVLGGHYIGSADTTTPICFQVNARNCTIDESNIERFYCSESSRSSVIWVTYLGGYATIKNCLIHDNGNVQGGILLTDTTGYNQIVNCHFYECAQGVYIEKNSGHNLITGCEFDHYHVGTFGHAIYFGDTNASIGGGYNEVSYCSFHDAYGQASLHIKAPFNIVHNNIFYNISSVGVPFSIYSQGSSAQACDNEIYSNTFINCSYAFWLGQSVQANPTSRNKIYDNTFTNVANCFLFNAWANPPVNWVNDTRIYYNNFNSCPNFITFSASTTAYVGNIVVAYNTFDVPVTNLSFESQYLNTMVYGNIGLNDYNVPSPLPVPPP
jgi:hypothetical protein